MMKLLNDPKYFNRLWIAALIILPFVFAFITSNQISKPRPIDKAAKFYDFEVIGFDKSGNPKVLYMQKYSDFAKSIPVKDEDSLREFPSDSYEGSILWNDENRPNGPYKFRIDPAKTRQIADALTKTAVKARQTAAALTKAVTKSNYIDPIGYSLDVTEDSQVSGAQLAYLSRFSDDKSHECVYRVRKDGTIQPLAYGRRDLGSTFTALFVWMVTSFFIAITCPIWNLVSWLRERRKNADAVK